MSTATGTVRSDNGAMKQSIGKVTEALIVTISYKFNKPLANRSNRKFLFKFVQVDKQNIFYNKYKNQKFN